MRAHGFPKPLEPGREVVQLGGVLETPRPEEQDGRNSKGLEPARVERDGREQRLGEDWVKVSCRSEFTDEGPASLELRYDPVPGLVACRTGRATG
jgi:hypothetical protein